MSKGHDFEKQAAAWLVRQGFDVELNTLVRGRITKRAYEVDIHATKEKRVMLINKKRYDLWVECKNLKTPVKRNHINSLIRKAQDLRKGYQEKFEDWCADILVVFSKSGFDIDAIKIADEYSIYLVSVDKKYNFIGNMTRYNFDELDVSEY